MLETLDLTQKLSKQDHKRALEKLEIRIGDIQRRAREAGIPIAVVFEGWDAAGKGTMINNLILRLDPRGFKVHPINAPTEEERLRPWLWRFWTRTPESGRIVIFDRSWYGRVLVERIDKLVKKKEWSRAYDEINSFERQLTDGGTVIIKFFLHITKSEQATRFRELSRKKELAWKVTRDDWKHHKQYERYYEATEEMLKQTDTSWAPWHPVEAHDRRFADIKILTLFADTIEQRLAGIEQSAARTKSPAASKRKAPVTSTMLQKADLSLSLDRETYEQKLDKLQSRLLLLEHRIYLERIPVVIVYEGWDASGKGGNIRRLVQGLDPRGYEVFPVAAPTEIEKRHHYLWRFWNALPKAGHITIFDRSWYGRVMVERVEGFCTEKEWSRAYQEINETEELWSRSGMVIVKFWLHIDKAEQMRRFKSRQSLVHKQWKITDEDWRNREKWDQYEMAVNEMLLRTSTALAPWTIVEANDKLFARIKALETVADRISAALE